MQTSLKVSPLMRNRSTGITCLSPEGNLLTSPWKCPQSYSCPMLKGCTPEEHTFLLSCAVNNLFSCIQDHEIVEVGKSGPFLFTPKQLPEEHEISSHLSCPRVAHLRHPGIKQQWCYRQQRIIPAKHSTQLEGEHFMKGFKTSREAIALSPCSVYMLLMDIYLPKERTRRISVQSKKLRR